MKVCLVSSEHSPWGGLGHMFRRQADLLAERHEVTLIHSGDFKGRRPASRPGVREVAAELSPELAATAFADDHHRRSAAVMAAIERLYADGGPDYLEASDYLAPALVAMQARRAGHPLLRETLMAVQVCSTMELLALHDGISQRPGTQLIADMEREQLRLADLMLSAGGDILRIYREYYGEVALPEGVVVKRPLKLPQTPPPAEQRNPDEPLKILFVGRLQRLKGALDLVEACLGLESDDWRLTMIGADTPTAPMGQSVKETIDAMCAGDPRIRIEDALPQAELQSRWAEHDLLVTPSRFEVWGNVALEGMRAGLPILATPVGGFTEIVEPGVTGWRTDGVGCEPIRLALERLLADREEVERVRASGAPRQRCQSLCDPGMVLEAYEREIVARAAAGAPGPRPGDGASASATAIVPYHRSSEDVEEAVRSLLAQTHEDLDVLIVNDGSFEAADDVLDRLVAGSERVRVLTQRNRGEPSARNLGARHARGDYVVMLDADNVLEPTFVERAIALLAAEPDLAYVTCWLQMIDADGEPMFDPHGYAVLGNRVSSEEALNWDGDALAVLPRRIFTELGYRYEPGSGLQSDWELYRTLRDDGRYGAIIPEFLARYRVRPESLLRSHEEATHRQSWNEARTRRRLRRHRWSAET